MTTHEILVRELEPKLVADYLRFFDDIYDNDSFLRFRDNPWGGGCYCGFYDDPRTEDEINLSSDKRSENRAAREKTIEKGKASCLLGYAVGKDVGRNNATPHGSDVDA